MHKYRSKNDSTLPNRPLVDRPPNTGNLVKIRSIGYVSYGYLHLYNFIDVKIGQDEPYAKFDLKELPDLEFLKKDFLILMEVLLDRYHFPYAFIPLNRRYIADPEMQLSGDQLSDLAESMHQGIHEEYPYKEMIMPTIVKRFDDRISPEEVIPDLCA